MISLQELIETYKQYGVSDYEIIKLFFTKNKIEDQAVKMLAELSEEKIKDLHYTNSYQKEYMEYCSAILYNEVEEKIKLELFVLAKKFLLYSNLNEDDLKRCQLIFDNNKITICPLIFYNYLAKEKIVKKELDEFEIRELENFIKRRDAHL